MMSSLRRLALAFPLDWSHRRPYSYLGRESAGSGPYYIHWDGGSGTFGEDWSVSARDERGVLLTGSARVYHPIRIAQYALEQFSAFCMSANARARSEFLLHAQWLRDNQRICEGISGMYVFDFPWKKYGAMKTWRSAMAQGEAISVLLRAEQIAPGQGFGQAAERASLPFLHDIEAGGVVWRRGPSVFLEEVANEHAPHILNGCIFALWGVWELHELSGDPALGSIVEQTLQTLRQWIDRYDCGWWSLYSLMRTANGHPHVATLKYHAFHIAQLNVLAQMFDSGRFQTTADRWTEQLNSPSSRMRVLIANALSLYDRALSLDTVPGGAHT